MANVFTKFKVHVVKKLIDLSADTLKLMLMKTTYTVNLDTQDIYSDISSEEITGTGYTAGGKTLTSVVVNEDAANHRMKLTAADVSWTTATFTARYAVLYDSTTTHLISYYDLGAAQSPAGVTFTIQWDATNGVLTNT